MKFTTALVLSSVAAGAVASNAPHRGRHARFHEKKAALPSHDEMVAELQKRAASDSTLAKRCGEMIYATYPGNNAPISFPNCFGACESQCGGGQGGSGGASSPAPAPTPAPSPAADPTPAAQSPSGSPEAQAHNQHTKQSPEPSAKPSAKPSAAPSSAPSSSPSGSGSSGSSGNSGASSGGKKGLAYNDASLIGSNWLKGGVSWAYNWASSGNGLNSALQYIPMMHDLGSVGSFPGAVAQISKDTPLLSFNEPDMTQGVGGSSIDPGTAASKHQQVMGPLKKAGHPIGAPAVSSSNAQGQGLNWLSSFASSCGADCAVDFCPVHWYGYNADASAQADQFKKYIQQAIDACHQHWPGKPIWVTEFAAVGPSGINDPNVNADFLKIVAPWMDGQSDVQRYSPFMVGNGDALGGSTPSAAGQALIAA